MLNRRFHDGQKRKATDVSLRVALIKHNNNKTTGRSNKHTKLFSLFIFFSLVKVSEDTRSAWRYCNTRATLGRGDTQAYQDQGRGLNNSLKLM